MSRLLRHPISVLHWRIPTKVGQRQILFVVRCPPSNINPLASPFYCPSVCSLDSPLCLHLFNDHPTLKCQVTLRAKEEHYTAAPCHAGRHHPHSGFNFSAFYRRASECTFARVHVWEEWRRETMWGFFLSFFFFFSKPAKESANHPPVPSTLQSNVSACILS